MTLWTNTLQILHTNICVKDTYVYVSLTLLHVQDGISEFCIVSDEQSN